MGANYRFGAVEIRPLERQVVVDGRAVGVGSRAFDVLLALIERRERVVTKNELLDLAWPGLVVEENNLQTQVSALRRVLGPQAIATIPGRGYRFTMSEERTESAPSGPASPTSRGPATSGTARRGLPHLPGPLLGREDELAALSRLLEEHRLITVVGAAGIGKTSLAITAAQERLATLRDGTVWVDLAAIVDPALVAAAIAQAMGLEAAAGADVRVALLAALRNLQLLLVVDNAEHVLDAVAELVDAILAHSPEVSMLATSRSALKLRSERLFRLGPLGVPEPGVALEEARTFGAIALLETRAQALDPRFSLDEQNLPDAVEICRHLDGIALAIELAAARIPLLGVHGLAERIGERFRLLAVASRLVPTRQQTLLAALDWSHELLSAAEQKVFRRLGVFASDFSIATASAVARDASMDDWAVIDALGALVDRSLVEVDAAPIPRYRLLESARAYALLKLGADAEELAATQRAHARAILDLFEKAEHDGWTEPETNWIRTYAPELDNVRAALDWSTQHAPEFAVALLGAARSLFFLLGLDFELRMRCEALDGEAASAVAPAAAARFWLAFGEATVLVQRERSLACSRKSIALYEEIGDDRGAYLALCNAALCNAAICAGGEAGGMIDRIRRLERPDWPPRVRYWSARAEGIVALQDGRIDDVGVAMQRALDLARLCQSESMVNRSLVNIADHALASGDVRKAIEVGREAMGKIPILRSYYQLVVRGNLSNALLQSGEVAEAREMVERFQQGSRAAQWDMFGNFTPVFALLAATEGRLRAAARLLGYADHSSRATRLQRRQPNEARAYELALSRVNCGLDHAERDALMAEGTQLDEEAVCALTLEAAPAEPRGARRKSRLES